MTASAMATRVRERAPRDGASPGARTSPRVCGRPPHRASRPSSVRKAAAGCRRSKLRSRAYRCSTSRRPGCSSRFHLDPVDWYRRPAAADHLPGVDLNIVGGGAQNRRLCQYTADACHRRVIAGPVEATVIGNLLVQAEASGAIDPAERRRIVADALFERIRSGASFWDVVYRPYMDRDLTKADVRGVVHRGLEDSRGNYRIVTKLFNIVQPDIAVFGRKDAQQCAVIDRIVRDLDVPVRLVFGNTVREHDGVAMSSRNSYLSEEERKLAPALHRALRAGEDALLHGVEQVEAVESLMHKMAAETEGVEVDYLALVDPDTFDRPADFHRDLLVAGAGQQDRHGLSKALVATPLARRTQETQLRHRARSAGPFGARVPAGRARDAGQRARGLQPCEPLCEPVRPARAVSVPTPPGACGP